MEPNGSGYGPGRNIVRTAEGRKEVIERFLVRQIDHRYSGAELVLVAVEDVVVPHANVEEIARRDSRRVVVVVLCARGRDGYQGGTV